MPLTIIIKYQQFLLFTAKNIYIFAKMRTIFALAATVVDALPNGT